MYKVKIKGRYNKAVEMQFNTEEVVTFIEDVMGKTVIHTREDFVVGEYITRNGSVVNIEKVEKRTMKLFGRSKKSSFLYIQDGDAVKTCQLNHSFSEMNDRFYGLEVYDGFEEARNSRKQKITVEK